MKRKLVDSDGRILGRVSVVDLLCLAVALALAVMVCVRFFFSGDVTSGGDDSFSYVLKISGVRQFTVDVLEVGDVLYESDSDTVLGTVRSVEVEPAEQYYSTVDGRFVKATIPEQFDLFVTVDAEGLVTNGQCYASRTVEVSANGYLYYTTKYLVGGGTVWSVQPEGDG